MQEVEILKELKHPNIIEYCGYFTGPDFGARSAILQADMAEEDNCELGSPLRQKVKAGLKGECLHIMMEFADGGDVQQLI